jgi:ATP-dependent Zn protease
MEALPAPLLALLLALVVVLLVLPVSRRSSGGRWSEPRLLLVGLVLLVIGVGLGAWLFFLAPPEQTEIPYGGSADSFLGLVKAGEVAKVVQQGERLTITPRGNGQIVGSHVPSELTNLVADIAAACAEPGAVADCATKVEISAEEPSQTGQLLTLLLTALLPVILIGAIFYFMLRQTQGRTGGGIGLPRRTARERLEELDALRSKSFITEDEYAAKRKAILEEL